MANFNIAYLIELKDRYTKIAEKVAKNNKFMKDTMERVKSGVQNMNNALDKAKSKLSSFGTGAKQIGGKISELGRNLASSSVAITGLFWKSLHSWEKQSAATATLDQALKSREKSLGMTSKQIQDMASTIQKKSIFGDEGIIQNVSNQLLTFDKVNGKVFQRANQAVIDMTSKLYGANASIEQSRMLSLALGKALQNPSEAMNSLGRAGVRFNKNQQAVVKKLVETGHSAEAQGYILEQLESKYKGAAEQLAKTQPLTVLQNAFDDMLEPLGQIVQELLVPLVSWAGKLIEVFNGLSKPVKVFIVGIMGIITIASPILMIIGGMVQAIGTISGVIGTVIGVIGKWNVVTKIATGVQAALNFVMSLNPIVWIIAAIVGLIAVLVIAYKKCDWFRNIVNYLWAAILVLWDNIKGFATDLWQSLQPAIQAVANWFSNVWQKVLNFGDAIKSLWDKITGILSPLVQFGINILTWTTPIGTIIKLFGKLKDKIDLLKGAWEKFVKFIKGSDISKDIENKKKQIDKEQSDDKKGGKQKQVTSKDVSKSGNFDASITVQAEKGTKVTKSKVKSSGNVNARTGGNVLKK